MSTWQGSRQAEGWTRRRETVETFRHLAELCVAIADNLQRHHDAGALECFVRLTAKVASAAKLPCFPPTAVRREAGAYRARSAA